MGRVCFWQPCGTLQVRQVASGLQHDETRVMTILVTGGAGYVGLNVVEALLASGREVALFDRGGLPAPAHRAVAQYVQSGQLNLIEGDVCDASQVARAFAERKPRGVIHCAAVTSGPGREARDPSSVVQVNLQGTINVLDAARRNAVRRFVYVGSGAAYGESLYRLQRLYEDIAPSAPLTLYAITKHATERMCMRLAELWSVDVVCARLGTVIGPWERDTGMRDNFGTHSQLARCAATGITAVLPPRANRRDWIYSCDVAAGLLALLDAPAHRAMLYNLSSGVDWGSATLHAWCDALQTVYNDFEYHSADDGETPNIGYTDTDRCLMDVGRIVNEFGVTLRGPQEAYAEYAGWIARTPEFWKI